MSDKAINMLSYIAIAVAVLLFSQAIGFWVNNNIAQNATLEVSGLIHFTHIRNFGGVFGLAQGSGWLFGTVSIGLLLGISAYLWLSKDVQRYEYICFGLVVGGGASNITDRLVYGSVIDFIDVQHIPFWNYVFNTADVMIHLGIWPMLLLSILAHRKHADS
ncbi:MAG: signal peptidase II [Proteobacteria bacterium]|nr:signal peptidase II [Pseudomonadota bacterium]MDA0927928.1 signal peptidase II [Pseudomonadota bacterium]